MDVPLKHVLAQGSVVAALGRAAFASMREAVPGARRPRGPLVTPGPWIEATLPPRPADLVRDYVAHVGGDPARYRDALPAHLFPQWSLPLAARTLEGAPYPLARAMNAGCRIVSRAPLPAGEALAVRARLEKVDDDGRRAILTQRVVTGTARVPDALVAELRAFVPLARRTGRPSDRARAAVPANARELARLDLARDAGLAFATLTGDFNPIHWLAPYARAAGFRGAILHGFGTLARALEALARTTLDGDPARLATVDVRFTRPLVLPARVGVYADDEDGLWVGDAPGGDAYLEGLYALHAPTPERDR